VNGVRGLTVAVTACGQSPGTKFVRRLAIPARRLAKNDSKYLL